jgi:hypothetical protein
VALCKVQRLARYNAYPAQQAVECPQCSLHKLPAHEHVHENVPGPDMSSENIPAMSARRRQIVPSTFPPQSSHSVRCPSPAAGPRRPAAEDRNSCRSKKVLKRRDKEHILFFEKLCFEKFWSQAPYIEYKGSDVVIFRAEFTPSCSGVTNPLNQPSRVLATSRVARRHDLDPVFRHLAPEPLPCDPCLVTTKNQSS